MADDKKLKAKKKLTAFYIKWLEEGIKRSSLSRTQPKKQKGERHE